MRASYHTAKINARINPHLKETAEKILFKVGLTPAEAIRLLYVQICCNRGLPFAVKIPNEETLRAIEETEQGIGLIESNNLEDFFIKTGLKDVKHKAQKVLRKRRKPR